MELHTVTAEWGGEQFTVVEPDYLLDISVIANCFEEYGHHPLMYTVNRLKARPNNRHTLLGNFAGSALDDIINAPADRPYNIADTLRSNFREKALEYACCEALNTREFKEEAVRQVQHLQQITAEIFRHADRSKALLEPSFVCPQLGIQGRVDLMTADFSLLVEQKSGKNVFPLKHYVQVLLYYGVLAFNFGQRAEHTDIRLLYSKYPLPTGLKVVEPLAKLLHEAIDFRNEVVAMEYRIANEGFGTVMPQLTPETLNTCHMDGFFYQRYLLPQLSETLSPLHRLSPLEKAYFERMMTFVVKEQLVGKTGGATNYYSCAADLWRMPLEQKREMGTIYTGLRIVRQERSSSYNGYDTITLAVPEQGADFMPDFRRGDMVYLYATPEGETPDASRSILYKGVVAALSAAVVVIRLNDGQQNPHVFSENEVYTIEHGSSDVGASSAIHGLYCFLTSSPHKRNLILGQIPPEKCDSIDISRSYHPDYDTIVSHAKQAKDYYLIVGPPGTGKTSMALRYLVEELSASSAVLLLAYTNRAVDEICGMLCDAQLDFIRLGGEYSCDERFRPYLLGNAVEENPRLDSLRQLLKETRLVVSTTATLMAKPFLLRMKHFPVAIVDEASQILEPGLVGILSAVDKFILIGDYKQLPAVVQQSEEDSAVSNPLLLDIHLDNCRHSLFERLIRTEQAAGRTDFIGILRKQGRMHPDIADFPCRAFYGSEQLSAVPLPHQQADALGYTVTLVDEMDEKLAKSRVLFFPVAADEVASEGLSDKVNVGEARVVADCARRLCRLMGDGFDAHRSLGIIVPYRNQIATIRRELEQYGLPQLNDVTIDTVERYQGSQRDVIIYSFTVSQPYQLDFLTSNCFEEGGITIDRKLNVVLTRARKQLVLVGNPPLLSRNRLFARLISHCLS